MLKLYIRVCSFSYARDLTNKQKQHSSNQNKALCKGLKKTTSEPVIGGVDVLNILLSTVYNCNENRTIYIWECCYICLLISVNLSKFINFS